MPHRFAPALWAITWVHGRHRLSIGAACFLDLAELIDLHFALGELGFNLQLASHSSNYGLQSADVHIGATFHLGNCRIADVGFPLYTR